jgi:hypothetical protein
MDVNQYVEGKRAAYRIANARFEHCREQLSTLIDGKPELSSRDADRAEELLTQHRSLKEALAEAKAALEHALALKDEEDDIDAKAGKPVKDAPPESEDPDEPDEDDPEDAEDSDDDEDEDDDKERTTKRVSSITLNERGNPMSDNPYAKRGITAIDSFFKDLVLASDGDPAAQARISHQRGYGNNLVRRAAGEAPATSPSFSSIVTPQYLLDEIAEYVYDVAPLTNSLPSKPLPETGLALTIPRVTTPTAAGPQPTELGEVEGQSFDTTDFQIMVKTYAAQQTVSRQAIDRGLGTDKLVLEDMLRRQAESLESAIKDHMMDVAVTGGAVDTDYDSIYSALCKVSGTVTRASRGLFRPTHIAVAPEVFSDLLSEMGTRWPMMSGSGSIETAKVNSFEYSEAGNAVTLPNKVTMLQAVALDPSEALVYVAPEIRTYRAPGHPLSVRAEQPQAHRLGVLIVTYEYAAFTAERRGGLVYKLDLG